MVHSPTDINFNLTPTEEGLRPKCLGLLTFFGTFYFFLRLLVFVQLLEVVKWSSNLNFKTRAVPYLNGLHLRYNCLQSL